jgi:hypothetical protein
MVFELVGKGLKLCRRDGRGGDPPELTQRSSDKARRDPATGVGLS